MSSEGFNTALESYYNRDDEYIKSNFLISIVQISDGVFDIAGCDISTGEFFVGQTDSLIDDVMRIAPAEIIYPEKDAEKNERK